MSPIEEKDIETFEVKEEENVDQWLMSYADMITLLLGFFAVLLSMSSFDQVKMEMFSQYFSNEPKKMTMSQLSVQIQQFAKEENLMGQVEARLTSRGVEISFKDKLMFNLGKTDLKEEAVPILTKISNLLKYQEISERKVLVEGHTDSLPMRSKAFPTNWELSSARAGMVVRFFLSQHLDPRRFQSSGYADTRPKNPETDRLLGQPENRRVVVVISPDSYISEQELLRKEWTVNGSTANLNTDFSKFQASEAPPVTITKTSSSAADVVSPEEEAASGVQLEEPAASKPVKQKNVKNKKIKAKKPVQSPAAIEKKAVSVQPDEEKNTDVSQVKQQPLPSPGKAATSAEKGAQQVSKDIDVHYSAGLKYLNENNKEMALQEFEKVLAIDSKHIPSILKVKKLKKELGK